MAPLEGPPPLLVELGEDDSGPVVRLSGELDITNVDSLRSTIEPLLDPSPACLTFDLSALTFMDSSGIALFLGSAVKVGTVKLKNPTDVIRLIIMATGLSGILRMDP